jgi:hypothetical protein
MITRATLESKRAEYDAERLNAEYALLRIQGALVAVDELLALVELLEADGSDRADGSDGTDGSDAVADG